MLVETAERPDSGRKELPRGYGKTMAALLPRDPDWMFVYWEITDATMAAIAGERGSGVFTEARQVLRVHDMSGPGGGAGYFDVPVRFEAGSWYVHVLNGGRAYRCELGLVTPAGEFIGIVASNTAVLPSARVSDLTDERWLQVSPDFEKLLELSGVEYIGKGSGEVAKSLAQRWEMLLSVFSRAASWGVSSLSSRAGLPPAGKSFRLAADCELVLYGATEPDAFVTVAGRRVKLNPDGTFSMRFALPDGVTDLPINAMSADEKEARKIELSVTRRTA
ncbi:MAG: hypothetical protein A2X32_09770 [Elusimicrobia bacterium GWC2_64_44]|nr:MAG: hypothetical protein A2X32_09770 [Elusimicrobia bacterium GWC2_64_44]